MTGGANCGAEILERRLDSWYVGEETKETMDLRCVLIRLVNFGEGIW